VFFATRMSRQKTDQDHLRRARRKYFKRFLIYYKIKEKIIYEQDC